MPHHVPLIATIVAGLTIAFALGLIAQRFRISPLVGYLLAGVIVGPFTPGYVADQGVASQLAEIGVILLMFGVGLHFSFKELLSVRALALPGAIAQMAVATALGMLVAWLLGWNMVAGFVFGLSLSVASTVVLLRALQERRILQTERGKIAVGWLIVEDLAMVVALVLLPALAGALTSNASAPSAGLVDGWLAPLGITFLKIALFVAFMLVVGRRIVPMVLHYVAHTGSRELFRLAVLAMALGVAFGASSLFGVSLALGAFFAGMMLAESELSQRAAEETMPLRDAFAVLFFVSVGMLFNPGVVLEHPVALAATLAIIILGKSIAALIIMRMFRRNAETSLTVAASLAQIGEFSFVLAGLGVALNLLPPEGRDLVLAGSIISIVLNPFLFALVDRYLRSRQPAPAPAAPPPVPANDPVATRQFDHTILVGYGRVGQLVAEGLDLASAPFLVVELDEKNSDRAREKGFETILGNAADPRILAETNAVGARAIYVAIPNGFEAGQIVEQARKANPSIEVVGRAHSDEELAHLKARGADAVIMGEQEIARGMLDRALNRIREPAPTVAEVLPPATPRMILTDAEHALLAEANILSNASLSPVLRAAVQDRLLQTGFKPDQLAAAESELIAKGCMQELGDDALVLTELGLLVAAPPEPG